MESMLTWATSTRTIIDVGERRGNVLCWAGHHRKNEERNSIWYGVFGVVLQGQVRMVMSHGWMKARRMGISRVTF